MEEPGESKILSGFSRIDNKRNGERGWIRTSDPRLKRALIEKLS
jgi:hypothetical protein